MGDQIRIEQLEIFAHIGVPDEERASAQRLTVSITFWPARQAEELEDQIERTVNYASVCAETKKFVAARSRIAHGQSGSAACGVRSANLMLAM